MPTLNWMGKEAVRNHHHTVPFRLLRDVGERSVGDPGSGNLIVEGDNLIALKALLPFCDKMDQYSSALMTMKCNPCAS
jgi:hypothetical protein